MRTFRWASHRGRRLAVAAQAAGSGPWKHLSTKTGDLETPNSGKEQTSATVFDIDKDGVNDFVITERTAAPSVVAYIRNKTGWTRYVVDAEPLHIEAGATFYDVDGDGNLDFIAGGDWKTNEVWWWENPGPAQPQARRSVEASRHQELAQAEASRPDHGRLRRGRQGRTRLLESGLRASCCWLAYRPTHGMPARGR